MIMSNGTRSLIACVLLVAIQARLAGEVRSVHPSQHPRFQRINVIDPDRVPARKSNASQGVRYRRWHIGEALPPAIWAQRFRMENPSRFGLDSPDGGDAWVSYGPDALLVDLHNGQLLQTVYAYRRNMDSFQH